jgi:hypothetical protein
LSRGWPARSWVASRFRLGIGLDGAGQRARRCSASLTIRRSGISSRRSRAAELAVERGRYAADRAERAFLACEPENRLVAHTLEARWETALADLAEAQAALAVQAQAQPELPSPDQLAADDAVVHCVSRRQAEHVLAAIAGRMSEVGLRLHSDKTRIVYCKDGRRRGDHEHTSFTFLGFTFRQRRAKDGRDGSFFVGFLPAMSTEALKAKSAEFRASGSTGALT